MNTIQKEAMACLSRGDWERALALVESGSLDANKPLTEGPELYLLLDQAVLAKNFDAVRRLLRAGADVNDRRGGSTPLMTACCTVSPDPAIIDELLSAGANVNRRAGRNDDGGGETALVFAAERGNLWTVKRLLQAGADVTIPTHAKETALFWAARDGRNIEVIKELLAARCPMIGTELHWPVFKRDMSAVLLLLDAGCKPDVALNRGSGADLAKGDTPIMVAARSSDLSAPLGPNPTITTQIRIQLINALVAAGASPNVANARGETPLLHAVVLKEFEIARALVTVGAKPDFGSKLGTPLARAKEKKLSSFIELFETR